MIVLAIALALQVMGDQQAQIDVEVERRVQAEIMGEPPGDMPSPDLPQYEQQTHAPEDSRDTGSPSVPAPPTKRQIKDLGRQIEREGDIYEIMGRCAGSMTPGEVGGVLQRAQSQPAGRYLIGRFERGFRRPKSDGWCSSKMDGIGG
jgi:hypothetical protein